MRHGLGLVACSGLAAVLGCGDSEGAAEGTASTTLPATSSTADSSNNSGQPGTTGSASNATSTTNADATTGTDDSAGEGPKLDVGAIPDAGEPRGCEVDIPQTCDEAETCPTTVGCEFFAIDLDQLDGGDDLQFAVSVSNVQAAGDASVTIERKNGGVWEVVEGPIAVAPMDLYTFLLSDMHQEESGKLVGGAFRITSDVPIVAYQFNPLNLEAGVASSDASLLYPVVTWDHFNHVVGWEPMPSGQHGAYLTVVAAIDGTQVEITPTTAVMAGPDVPATPAGQTLTVSLDEGDIVELMTKTPGETFTGTRVLTDEQHPVGLFSGAECTFVLEYSCDHIETQLSGLRLWGMDFVASRVPPRISPPETSVWQVYASEDQTTVTFDAAAVVTGLPASPSTLNAGEVLTFEAGGTDAEPGDFRVTADKPIAVVNYMTGSSLGGSIGDPAMVQIPPVEQFLPRYVVLVPTSWDTDTAVITRPVGVTVNLDGAPIPDNDFVPVGPDFEVARVPVADGVHSLDGSEPISIIMVGTTPVDSYAYVGGIGTSIINPTPEG